jgi:hypothetical protein
VIRDVVREQSHPVGRNEIHRVHQHDPHEHGEGEGRDEAVAIAVLEDAFCLVVDETDQQLDHRLAAPRHARGRAAHHPPDEADADQTEQNGYGKGIHVHRPEASFADRLLEERQVVLDVLRRSQFGSCGHRRLRQYSRTKKAMEKISIVTTNAPSRAATTACP